MTLNINTDLANRFSAQPFRFPDSDISWAGENPWGRGFCFGSEDGRLLVKRFDDPKVNIISLFDESNDPINGVAFLGRTIAASTRSAVRFFDLPHPGENWGREVIYDGGAHDIIKTLTRKFIAPLGINGLLSIAPTSDSTQILKIFKTEAHPFNFYKVTCLGEANDSDILACALRCDGWATVLLNDSNPFLNVISKPDLDVVDICPIVSDQFPRAAIAVGHDCSFILIRDVLVPDENDTIFQIDGLPGIAYRVMSAQGHIILLTSESLCILPDFASRFLDGQDIGNRGGTRCIDGDYVDAFIAYDEWVLLVMPDGSVASVKIEELIAKAKSPLTFSPTQLGSANWLSPQRFGLTAVAG